jgi:3-hydroxyacyl-[acyl-carrier-protein] dehydratase
MLKDDFYTIKSLDHNENVITATLELNEKHAIYSGHFPGQPVLPGVCMMQMVKEIAGTALNCELQLTQADELKFLITVDPNEHKTLQSKLMYSALHNTPLSVSATFLIENKVCFKFKGAFLRKNTPAPAS